MFNVQDVADIVAAAGIPTVLEHTGGGCWVIFAGPQHQDADGVDRYAIAAGPGADLYGDGVILGDPSDFYVSPDADPSEIDIDDFPAVGRLDVDTAQGVADLIISAI